ncbi:Uncharacterized conserved protein YbjT, contains NAD(P)-binding and DUF2867 domains [Flexibacter flexilis DSM 6793]|uniref:Uncharacterized conserved protein YbjT, contains NAD(P)-binding and DUF2867 domains n=1 Tax=Flexibacter flexilis DSM 6793 TaxID=927664 RepID=A0A1I1L963_9BACT|nr:NmrA family NAD(P)-binding protein [Flexibacter flexilis]SFC67578.1 Uncharacterized conserved protein YbjT, contains NAD(P)-binding and DUF2867 domains [Flexibacter flexilis DSM 6793]
MKIVVTGSLGNIGQHLVKNLLASGNNVTVISSNKDRQAAIEQLGVKAAVGSITDTAFLAQVFAGADAVFAMTPPNMGGQNIIANTTNAGKSYAQAIEKAGVKRVVMLSSVGAEHDGGTGPITGLHHIEQLYSELSGVAVTFLRAGYFYTNFYNDIPVIKNAGIIGSNFPASTQLPLVHPSDIAVAAAEELQKPAATGHQVRYIVSDYVSAAQVASALGEAIGKPALPWVEFTDEQAIQGMTGAGVPSEIAGLYTEMGAAIRAGKLQADFEATGAVQNGVQKLTDFAKEFAANF